MRETMTVKERWLAALKMQALDRLPDVYRTALILYELEELPGEEVARLTGVPLGTVWVRLHRGRERLMQILSRGERS